MFKFIQIFKSGYETIENHTIEVNFIFGFFIEKRTLDKIVLKERSTIFLWQKKVKHLINIVKNLNCI